MGSSFKPGSLVSGRYRVVREIGRGGMATVYLARDETHERDVAIKVLSPSIAGVVGGKRFLTEIRTTAGLGHPNILPLIDSGQVDGAPYYILPFVPGESLRSLIDRKGHLPVGKSLQIAAALASALDHAHAHEIVHRDVKPSNILLDENGNPYLADFGIARALSDRGETLRTTTGFVLGTPRYMSPEQIAGESDVDGRTDIYALACVIYELLTGAPPFDATKRHAIFAAHLTRPPPSVREHRPDVPEAVDRLLLDAMAKDPADRIATAAVFAHRLDLAVTELKAEDFAVSGSGRRFVGPFPWTTKAMLAGALAVVALVATLTFGPPPPFSGDEPLDTTRYTVVPGVGADGPWTRSLTRQLEAALDAWSGIDVIPATALAGPRGGYEIDDLPEAAREVAAGRLLSWEGSLEDDSLHVRVSLLAAASPSLPIRSTEFALPPQPTSGVHVEAIVDRAIEHLLFGRALPASDPRTQGTRSVAARRSFDQAWDALQAWDLIEAEKKFGEAVQDDPYFDLALLWQAQAMNWLGEGGREWEPLARRAAVDTTALFDRERTLAAALDALTRDRHPDACAFYRNLQQADSSDFAAWFGLGECQRMDPIVVPDPTSKTGWSFRGSAHSAAAAYRQAFQELPATYRTFGPGSFELVRRMLYAMPTVRQGRSRPPESRAFIGFSEWRGDSLAIIAVPAESAMAYDLDFEAQSEAMTRQSRALLQLANEWVRAFPDNASALYVRGRARDLVADPSALQDYQRARELTNDAGLRRAAGVREVLVQVRLGLPADTARLRQAVSLGGSLLEEAGADPAGTGYGLDQVAVLLGRPSVAAVLTRIGPPSGGLGNMPVEVTRDAGALLAFAAAGGPSDSIRTIGRRVEQSIERLVPRANRTLVKMSLLEQPAYLAFPDDTLSFLTSVDGPQSAPARAMAAMARGDASRARAILGPPEPNALLDIVLAQAHVLVALGQRQEALELLSSHLDSLVSSEPGTMQGVARIGALVRTALLRARLEREMGSPEAAERWATAVGLLWASAEEGVRSTLEGIREPASSHPGG